MRSLDVPGEGHTIQTREYCGCCTVEIETSLGTIGIILVNHFQERRIKTGANANMGSWYNQGNDEPIVLEEKRLPCSF